MAGFQKAELSYGRESPNMRKEESIQPSIRLLLAITYKCIWNLDTDLQNGEETCCCTAQHGAQHA